MLASISERGIEEPLGGVDTPHGRLLLDGFRRNRCAAKLGIECVPYVSWGEDQTQGIASLLSVRRQRTLSILEQARFVDELLSTHQMTMADVAELVSRSKAWVSYPSDHPLTAEFEDQMISLVREYKGDGEYLSVHHPAEPGAKDDAPDGTVLMLDAAAGGGICYTLFG